MEIINPFDSGGYTLAEMTEAINILPNVYTRLGQMGLFRYEGITIRTVIVEQNEGTINLLPTVALGGRPTQANKDTRSMRNFTIPWIPHDDVIVPQDLQGIRAFGSGDAAEPLATLMDRKLQRMRLKHAQTREYMEINALRGICKDGAGTTLFNYFTEFGVSQQTVDFTFGTALSGGNDLGLKVHAVKRAIETELKGETMTGILVLCGPDFFDNLTKHDSMREAYKYFQNLNAGNPYRDDLRTRFPFKGVVFEEYNATVTLSDGTTTERLVPANEAIAFPLGTTDTFVTYGAPGNFMEVVNTIGLPMYARQIGRRDGSGIDIKTEASIIPINKRPRLQIKLHSSN